MPDTNNQNYKKMVINDTLPLKVARRDDIAKLKSFEELQI